MRLRGDRWQVPVGKVPNSHRNKGTADAGGWRPLRGQCSGLVPSASGGCVGTGSSGAARGSKPSPMAAQGWRPLPQLRRAQQRRTQHFLRHGELTDSLGGYKSELKSRGWTGCLGTRNLSPRKGGLRKALSAIIFIIFSSGSLGSGAQPRHRQRLPHADRAAGSDK